MGKFGESIYNKACSIYSHARLAADIQIDMNDFIKKCSINGISHAMFIILDNDDENMLAYLRAWKETYFGEGFAPMYLIDPDNISSDTGEDYKASYDNVCEAFGMLFREYEEDRFTVIKVSTYDSFPKYFDLSHIPEIKDYFTRNGEFTLDFLYLEWDVDYREYLLLNAIEKSGKYDVEEDSEDVKS